MITAASGGADYKPAFQDKFKGDKHHEITFNYIPSAFDSGNNTAFRFTLGSGDEDVDGRFYQKVVSLLYNSAAANGKAFFHGNQDDWFKNPNLELNTDSRFGAILSDMLGYAKGDGKLTESEKQLLKILESDPAGLAAARIGYQETTDESAPDLTQVFNEKGEHIFLFNRDGTATGSKYLIGQALPFQEAAMKLIEIYKEEQKRLGKTGTKAVDEVNELNNSAISNEKMEATIFDTSDGMRVEKALKFGITYAKMMVDDSTDEYLKKAKEDAITDFKFREIMKFKTKMERISGNQDMGEMLDEADGTNLRFSNMHTTDIERLNKTFAAPWAD